jgi:polyferredoxin
MRERSSSTSLHDFQFYCSCPVNVYVSLLEDPSRLPLGQDAGSGAFKRSLFLLQFLSPPITQVLVLLLYIVSLLLQLYVLMFEDAESIKQFQVP